MCETKKIMTLLKTSSSKNPVKMSDLKHYGKEEEITSLLNTMMENKEVMCCKSFKPEIGEDTLWWRTGVYIAPKSEAFITGNTIFN